MDLVTLLPLADISRSVPSLFTDSGAFAKAILLLLFVISVISWAIIWDRTRLFLKLRAKGNALRQAVWNNGASACLADVARHQPSVEGAILAEAKRYIGTKSSAGTEIVVDNPQLEEVERARMREVLDRRASGEISEMERHLIFLSTTTSVAPFLGLMGTVWGIMSSFVSMGAHGAASIEVVGPGIAEALVTTIAGLAAAIPALIGYNLLVRQVHRKESLVDLFISRLLEQVIVTRERGGSIHKSPERTRTGAPL